MNPTLPQGSATVLDVDLWTLRRGERLAKAWHRAPDPLTGQWSLTARGASLEPVKEQLCAVAADALDTLLATQPIQSQTPADMHRAVWWDELLRSPELAALRARTMHHPDIAQAAAMDIAQAYAAAKREQESGEGGGKDGKGKGKEGSEKKGPGNTPGEAIAQAKQTAEDAEAIKGAFGLGVGNQPGIETQLDARLVLQLTRAMRTNEFVRSVVKMAGQFLAKANRLRAQRTEREGMEVTGLDLSGDVGRLVPSEAAQVAGLIPELELLALMRVAERRALSYRRSEYAQERGPVVVSVDESGSMGGERIIAAKAIALAITTLARQDKRAFTLVGWSTGVPRLFHSTPDAAADAPRIMDWLTAFQGGGTDLTLPLRWLTRVWPQQKKGARADHIVITDDTGEADEQTLVYYLDWRARTKVRTFGFRVGGRGKVDGMTRYCDGGAWSIPNISPDASEIDTVLTL